MPTVSSPGLIGGPRTTTTNTFVSQSAAQKELVDLSRELEKFKIQQALDRARAGQPANTDPAAANQAAQLAAQMQRQQAAAGSNQALQTERIQSTERMTGAQLAAQLQRQLAAQGSNQGMQTERIQSSERMTAAQLAAQMQQLQTRQAGDRTIQGDRIQSTERVNTQNLAAQAARQLTDIKGKKELQTDASLLEEKRKKDSAARALALFRATPGGMGTLNVKAAAAELG